MFIQSKYALEGGRDQQKTYNKLANIANVVSVLAGEQFNFLKQIFWVKGVGGGVKCQKHKWGHIYRVFPPFSRGFGKIEKFQAVSEIWGKTRKEKSTVFA